MLNVTTFLAKLFTNVGRPFPARLIGRTANRHASDSDQIELSLFEFPGLLGAIKPLQNYFKHSTAPFHSSAMRSRRMTWAVPRIAVLVIFPPTPGHQISL